ncbi:atlastin-3-like [Dermacentor albipictus]|uniref:atlastin-3-like n=1 Tax=Dermacentor albipictus TaxID=60249 RepID=UPI0038FC4C7B
MVKKERQLQRSSGSDGVGSGHELQIVRINEERLELDEVSLKRILLDDRVKDKPIAVVSVAGGFRTGKSFLLGFFLRYLHNLGRSVWLGDPDAPLRGFQWRDGCQRHTTGILVWSEVFLVKTSKDQEIAVLLMDTQGMYDNHSTIKESAIIFALSTMMSSVLVYNLSQIIKENDLQYLELFVDYGRLAQQQRAGKPFQKLLFLVRDWYHLRDAEYGADGGRKILERCLEISEEQPEQLQQLRRYIHSSFTDIDCFLLPHPGRKAATGVSFDGRLADIDEEFKQQLQDLVSSLLDPDNLISKSINGQDITCREFTIYMKAYIEVFNGGELPEPMSVLQATAKANNLAAVFKALKLYRTNMKQLCKGGKMSADRLRSCHARERQRALDLFQNTAKMGGDEFSQPYLERLTKEIDQWFKDFATRMTMKSCLVSKRCRNAQLGGATVLTIGTGAFVAAGVPVAAGCCAIAALVVLVNLSLTGFKGCKSTPEEESHEIEEGVVLVEVNDELLDGRQKTSAGATTNLRSRQGISAVKETSFNRVEEEIDESPANPGNGKQKRKKKFFRKLFGKARRKSRGPTELDRLKQC